MCAVLEDGDICVLYNVQCAMYNVQCYIMQPFVFERQMAFWKNVKYLYYNP